MTDKKISQLPDASTPLAGTEVLPIVQSAATVKVSSDNLTVKNIRSNATTGILQIAGPGAGATRTMTVPNANFTAARIDAGQTFTGVQVMTSPNIITSINDTNGNELIGITATGSAVNELTIGNAATGNNPVVSATGTDTNIGITLTPKGSGDLKVSTGNFVFGTSGTGISDANNNEIFKFTATASAVNELTVTNAATGNRPAISATGDDTNIGITLTPKGSGNLIVNSFILAGTSVFPSGVSAGQVFKSTIADWSATVWNSNATPYGLRLQHDTDSNGTGNEFLLCLGGSTVRATIRSNGGIANYQANNVDLSDARTKKEINPAASMWDKIGALEIVTYKYNDQTHDDVNVGVIAQQVESVEPVWVDSDGFGETPEDGVPIKTVYTKDIYFAAIKALQEAMERIEKLEAKVASLTNK